MKPTSESTKLEGKGGFVEYEGANKLKDMKALITGGEYVTSREQAQKAYGGGMDP